MGLEAYELLGEIARGGMGMVRLARHRGSGERVAIKFLLPGADFSDFQRFAREARALELFDHPNIIGIREFGQDDDRAYLVMDYRPGQPLRAVLRERHRLGDLLDRDRVLDLVRGLAAGLAASHEQGIVHRDLKPGNVIIEEESGVPVIIDFGLNKLRVPGVSGASLTASGEIVGTPAYMAPEQIDKLNFGPIGPATDIWALGVIMYEMLAGRRPFEGASPLATLASVIKDAPPSLKAHRPEPEDAALIALCEACLSRKASARPSAREVLDALRRETPLKPEAKPRPPSRLLLPGLGLLALALVSALAYRSLHPSLTLLDGRAETWTKTSLASLNIKLNRAGEVSLERAIPGGWKTLRALPCAPDGALAVKLEALEEGENLFRLRDGADSIELKVFCDTRPPRIRIDGWAALTDGEQAEIRGSVADDGLASLTINERRVDALDGAFLYRQRTRSREFRIVAEDRAGNRSEKTIEGLPREPYQRFLERVDKKTLRASPTTAPLLERGVWNRLSRGQQDRIIARVAGQLAPRFRHLSTEEFGLAENRNRLAIFEHRATAMAMVLVPGQLFKSGGRRLGLEELSRQEKDDNERYRRLDKAIDVRRAKRKWNLRISFEELLAAQRAMERLAYREAYVAPVLVGRDEVTQKQWRAVFPLWSRRFGAWGTETPDGPADSLRALEIQGWLEKTGLRLPGEHEWEYAARAGSDDRFYWGPTYRVDHANAYLFNYRANETRDEKQKVFRGDPYRRWLSVRANNPKLLNAFGLWDTAGDAWEMTRDRVELVAEGDTLRAVSLARLKDLTGSTTIPVGFEFVVYRGGNWSSPPHQLRPSHRTIADPSGKPVGCGFRAFQSLLDAVESDVNPSGD